jgi:hypothetical protein
MAGFSWGRAAEISEVSYAGGGLSRAQNFAHSADLTIVAKKSRGAAVVTFSRPHTVRATNFPSEISASTSR